MFDLGTQDAFISLFCNPLGPSHHLPGAGRRRQTAWRGHPPTPLVLAQKGGTFFTRYQQEPLLHSISLQRMVQLVPIFMPLPGEF